MSKYTVAQLERYRTLHFWMILPMLLMQLGIFQDYWMDFTDNAWSVHVHYWTGTIWYIYLIIQPYYATHQQMNRHRTNGIIGMFVAGAVCFTAFSMMHRDIVSAERSAANREAFGPFEPWFFYGVAAVEIVMIAAFGFAVIMSILKRKQLEDHAWWLIASVFIIMMPATARGILGVDIAINREMWPNINIMRSVYISQVMIITLLLLGAWKYRKLRHPATWFAVVINLFSMLIEQLGRSEAMQRFLNAMIKG